MIRNILILLTGILPASKIKNFFLRLLGYSIVQSSMIHPVLIWNCRYLVLESYSKLGPCSVYRDLDHLILKKGAQVGQLNWITASLLLRELKAPCSLVMHEASVITNRHYIDASGGVAIERASALTGVRSTLMTHGVSYETNSGTWKPIHISHHNLIGSNSILVPGVVTKPNSVYGMGSLITGRSSTGSQLFLSQPSRPKRKLQKQGQFFKRKK